MHMEIFRYILLRISAYANFHDDEEKLWRCSTGVFGGKNVAKKFRAEMRLSFYDVDTSVNSNCNVKCLDDFDGSG